MGSDHLAPNLDRKKKKKLWGSSRKLHVSVVETHQIDDLE